MSACKTLALLAALSFSLSGLVGCSAVDSDVPLVKEDDLGTSADGNLSKEDDLGTTIDSNLSKEGDLMIDNVSSDLNKEDDLGGVLVE